MILIYNFQVLLNFFLYIYVRILLGDWGWFSWGKQWAYQAYNQDIGA